MRPNKYMNGGLNQTSQSAYYVDDDAPRLILSVSAHSIYENESFVLVSAVIKSSGNTVWHSDVVDPKMRSNETNATYVTLEDLIYNF